ncbi:MAG: Na+/H+ antiporter NhaC family protein [Bacteroidales bacterium]
MLISVRRRHAEPVTFWACLVVALLFHPPLMALEGPDLQAKFPARLVAGIPAEVTLSAGCDSVNAPLVYGNDTFWVQINGGSATVKLIPVANKPISFTIGTRQFVSSSRTIPLWFSVIPPLIAILIALLFREVFSALVLGLLSGTFMIAWYGGTGFLASIGAGLFRIVDTYVIQATADKDHVSIIIFSFMIGGMVHIITRNGGMKGIVRSISGFASSRRSTLVSTWLLGMVVFFDDYANTLVVGNTMRPMADRMKISREKLSYVVDSTAAPVTAIAFITTWIGAELSYIKNAVDAINEVAPQAISESPYSIFFQSLAYSFYPILTLFFVLMIILSKRDFGPMRKAEALALQAGDENSSADRNDRELDPDPAVTPRAFNALIPVLAVVFGTCAGLVVTGLEQSGWNGAMPFGANLSNVIGHADSFRSLLWASFSGLLLALILSVAQRILSLQQAVESMINGFKTMLSAMLILVLAWSLAMLTQHLHTAEFLSSVMLRLHIAPQWLPVITFLLASMVSFSTGSSWGTMAILYPLLLPTSWSLFIEFNTGQQEAMMLFHCIIASVLAGSVFGDHCSPISDTTILSSLATGCNHVEHVRTQLPYALTVGGVAVLTGLLPVSFGLHPAIAFLISIPVMWLVIRFAGKPTEPK